VSSRSPTSSLVAVMAKSLFKPRSKRTGRIRPWLACGPKPRLRRQGAGPGCRRGAVPGREQFSNPSRGQSRNRTLASTSKYCALWTDQGRASTVDQGHRGWNLELPAGAWTSSALLESLSMIRRTFSLISAMTFNRSVTLPPKVTTSTSSLWTSLPTDVCQP